MVRRIGLAALAVVMAVVAVVAIMPLGVQQARASSVTVDMKDLAFSPATIQISQGDTVTWTNDEEIMPHDVTSGALGQPDLGQQFGSDILTPGQTFSATFSDAGEFTYICRLHPTMTGVVIVSAS
jgi:plastocyanin